MAEIASLVLAIDSGQVAPAVADLNKLDAAAAKVTATVDKAEKEFKDLDGAARSMSDGVTQTVTRIDQVNAAGARMSTTFNGVGASFGRFMAPMANVRTTIGEFTSDFARIAPAAQNAGGAVAGAGNTVRNAANNFGLAGHQIRSLGQQFTDLAVQIGSGGGIFRPLLQQGPQIADALGGPTSALRLVREGIASIPTAVKVAGAGLGIVGAVGAAAAALASLNADIEKTEAKIRTFNTPDTANSIIKTSKASAAGTGLDPSALTNIEQLSQRQRQQLGLLDKDIGALSSAAARLSVQMRATGEESQQAIATLTKLLSQTTITGAEAVRFAQAFPQFASSMAAAFNVPLEKLLELDPAMVRVNSALANAVIEMGKGQAVAPTFSGAMGELAKQAEQAAINFERLTGLGAAWTSFWTNVAEGAGVVARALGAVATAAENASASIAAAKMSANEPDRSGSGLDWAQNTLTNMQGMGDSPGDGKKMSSAYSGQFGPELTNAVNQGNDPLERALQDVRTGVQALPTAEQADQVGQQITGELRNNMSATVNGFAGVGQRFASGVTVWQSGNAANKTAVDQNTTSTRDGLRAVEDAVNRTGAMMAASLEASGNFVVRDPDGFEHVGTSNESWARAQAEQEAKFRRSVASGSHVFTALSAPRPGNVSNNGMLFGGPLMGGKSLAGPTREDFERYKAGGISENEADDAIINRTLMSAIMPALGAMNDNAGMDRAPTPDPYRDRNPDYFYNNTTGQVNKAKDERDTLRTLPKDIAREIADALVKAGLIGEKIGEGIVQAATRPTAAPTAQDGWLPNRGPIRGNYGPSIYNRTAMR